jgi:hypothetical protein
MIRHHVIRFLVSLERVPFSLLASLATACNKNVSRYINTVVVERAECRQDAVKGSDFRLRHIKNGTQRQELEVRDVVARSRALLDQLLTLARTQDSPID